MKRVIIESPLAGSYAPDDMSLEAIEYRGQNKAYTDACLRDSLLRGEAPFASAPLYARNGVLNDAVPEERERGIQAGFEWGRSAELYAVYADRGMTEGMKRGIEWANTCGIPVEYRTLSFSSVDGRQSDERPEVTRPIEAETLRRKRFEEIGKLPLDYRTYVIIVEPSGRVSLAAEGMTFWEMMGIHQFALARLQNAILLQQMSNPDDPTTRETDEPQRTM